MTLWFLYRTEVWQLVACKGIWRPQEEETEGMTQANTNAWDQYVDKQRKREEIENN